MLEKGMFIADRYEIMEKIGTGGMADVYRAKCHKLNRFVAIKVLKQEFSNDTTFVAKFRVEAQSVAGLTHANIVNVYDVGDEAGIHYIVMELVEGVTLKKYIERRDDITTKEVVSIAIQVAQGIEAAHNHGIVHRDIKPQNIIISKDGKVKVADFGIARAATSNTINSAVMGSVHYMSPEQARGGYSDQKSDIYSFGVMLFEMLTKKLPFDGDNTVAVAVKHLQEDVPLVSTINPDVPASVEKIVEKCTQKKTERRYQNISDVISDLKKSLITPDENFVIVGENSKLDSTVMLTSEEVAAINKKNRASKKIEPYKEEVYEEEEDGKSNLDIFLTAVGILIVLLLIGITVYVVAYVVKNISNSSASDLVRPTSNEQVTQNDGNVKVPNLVGLSKDDAKKKLNGLGLGFQAIEDYSELQPEGYVFLQTHEANSSVRPNTTIVVTISKGPKIYTLGDYEGKTIEEVREILEKQIGMTVEVAYEPSATVAIGLVTRTSLEVGSKIKNGDTITVYLCSMPADEEVEVPTIIGKTEDNANIALDEAGLTVGEVTKEYSDLYPAGYVMAQSPKDDVVLKGTKVDYVISLGKEPSYSYKGTLNSSIMAEIEEPETYISKEIQFVVKNGSTILKTDSYVTYTDDVFPYEFTLVGKSLTEVTVEVSVRFVYDVDGTETTTVKKASKTVTLTVVEE